MIDYISHVLFVPLAVQIVQHNPKLMLLHGVSSKDPPA